MGDWTMKRLLLGIIVAVSLNVSPLMANDFGDNACPAIFDEGGAVQYAFWLKQNYPSLFIVADNPNITEAFVNLFSTLCANSPKSTVRNMTMRIFKKVESHLK